MHLQVLFKIPDFLKFWRNLAITTAVRCRLITHTVPVKSVQTGTCTCSTALFFQLQVMEKGSWVHRAWVWSRFWFLQQYLANVPSAIFIRVSKGRSTQALEAISIVSGFISSKKNKPECLLTAAGSEKVYSSFYPLPENAAFKKKNVSHIFLGNNWVSNWFSNRVHFFFCHLQNLTCGTGPSTGQTVCQTIREQMFTLTGVNDCVSVLIKANPVQKA